VHSETNVQVQGIDEADIVETDSDFLYVVRDGELIIAKAWPADEMSVVSRTRIEGQPIGEYLLGDRLTVVSQSYDDPWRDIFTPDEPETASNPTSNSNSLILADYGGRFAPDYPTPRSGSTIVSFYDVSDRSDPKLVQKTKLDGTYVESRRIDDQVFVVQRSQRLSAPGPTLTCEPIEDQQAASDALIPIDDFHRESCTYETRDDYIARVTELFETMLPHYASYDAEGNLVRTGLAIAPEDIYQPQVKTARNLISVVSINMSIDEPGLSGASGILTSGADTIYGGWDGLYVLERSYSYEDGDITRILKFDWNADTGMVDFAAFGHVAGYLLNQFSVDTFDGHLRIATTLWNRGGGNYSDNAENTIFVLRDDEGVMEVVGDLQNLGFTEYIKSVRFMGDRAFVTTFREIDPFFVIDMSNPQEPLPVGHVTLPGFSSYMQMIDENHVLTIGRNAVTESTGSTQVILFDVTDITRPRIVGRHSFYRDSISIAETDHHAFGWFAAHDVLAIPLAEHRRRRIDTDEDGYRETWEYYREDDLALLEIDVTATVETRDGVELRGEVPNDSQVLRGAFIDNVLYSIAHDSITAVDINDPTIIIAQVRIAPADSDPPDGSEDGEAESRDWLMAKQAREAVVRHLGRPVAPMLLTAERPQPSDGHHDSQRSFLFRVGDQIVHVSTDAEGNASLIDDRFEFAARHAARWRNESNPTDVNGDNVTSPIDALVGINELERTGPRKLTIQSVLRQIDAFVDATGPRYDVSGDGWLSPIDVLWVINWLENQTPAEGEYTAAVDAIVSTEESYFKVSTQPTRSGPISLVEQSHELLQQAVDESADDDDRDFGDAKMWVPDEDLLSDTAN
ncbi:MAG TPA: beta-propeller domain-containing protein, partial [Pirellulaceae bacterium]|nr:beta-propeller domain-containing protein [Pirellulaceae bacterium]